MDKYLYTLYEWLPRVRKFTRGKHGQLIKLFTMIGLVILAGLGIVYIVLRYQNDPERLIDQAVPEMIGEISTAGWTGDVIMKYATPEFRQYLIDHNLTSRFAAFSYLGQPTKFIGDHDYQFTPDEQFAIVIAEFQFQAAPATITLQLARHGNKWLIYSFKVDSPLFQKPAAPPPAP